MAQMIGGRWESKNMRNLFAPNSPHDVGVDVILNSHIDLLEAMINEPKVLVENVEKTEEDSELTYENMFYIEKKATYLRQAFTIAIEYMPDKTWQQCCEEAIQELENVGYKTIKNWQTLSDWNRAFRVNGKFTHPNPKKKYSPMLLDLYPEAKDLICSFASSNLGNLSCERLAMYVRDDVAEEIYEKIGDETELTFEEFVDTFNLSEFSVSSASRYLKYSATEGRATATISTRVRKT